MLLREHAGCQRVGGIVGQHGDHGLFQILTVVEFGGDLVNSSTGKFTAIFNGALVGVQPWKRGQQAGMDVEQATLVMLDETRRKDAHEPRQHHQGRPTLGVKSVDGAHEFGIKGFAAGVGLVVQHCGGNAMLLRKLQAFGIGFVADDGSDGGTVTLWPVALLGGADDGGHVGAATGNQNHDIAVGCHKKTKPVKKVKVARRLGTAECRTRTTTLGRVRW